MRSPETMQAEAVNEIDHAVWRGWESRGQRRDQRAGAARIIAVKWFCIIALLATALFWMYASPYGLVLKTIVASGAIAVMCQALSARRAGFAAVFALIALLFNPFIAVFGLSGAWQFGAVVGTVLPFAASLVWLKSRLLSSTVS